MSDSNPKAHGMTNHNSADIPPLLAELLSRPVPEHPAAPAQPSAHASNHRAVVHAAKGRLFTLLGYQPHHGQRVFHESPARFKVLVAGARFGKSLAAAREVLAWLAIPGSRGWIVAPSYRLGEKEFRYLAADVRTLFGGAAKITDGGIHRPSAIIVSEGGEAHVLSAANPESLLGEELDWVVLSEASRMDGEVWPRFLRARLSTRLGVAVIPSTPAGFNWMHGAFLRGLGDEAGDWASFQFRTEDNPLIPASEIDEARASLPPHTFAEQYGGEFTQPEGSVYTLFDPAIHVIGDARLRRLMASPARSAGHYIGIDWGYTAPMVMLRAMLVGRVLVVMDEFHGTHALPGAAARDFFVKSRPERVAAAFCDPADKRAASEASLATGCRVRSADNAVARGIALVRSRLVPDGSGEPGLLVHESCKNLIREFTTYAWGPGRSGGEPAPAKGQSDHCMDALRYLCTGLDRELPMARQEK